MAHIHQINFLPQDVRNRAYVRALAPWMVLAVVGAAGIIWASLYLLTQVNTSLQDQVTSRVNGIVASAKSAEGTSQDPDRLARLTDARNRTLALNQLSHVEVNWAKAFTAVEQLVPKEIVLSTYSVATTTAPNVAQIRLTGKSPSNVSFAAFIDSLHANASLKNVSTESYAFTPTTGAVTFSVLVEMPLTKLTFWVDPATVASPTPKL